MAVLIIFSLFMIYCVSGGTGVALFIGVWVLALLVTLWVADYRERSRQKSMEEEDYKIIYPKKDKGAFRYSAGVQRGMTGVNRNVSKPKSWTNAGRAASSKPVKRISDTERYIREEMRWHAWECPHGDPYGCDCD